jgi:hypothetical protein
MVTFTIGEHYVSFHVRAVIIGWFPTDTFRQTSLARLQIAAVSNFRLIGDDAISQVRAAVAMARDALIDQGAMVG